MFFDFVAAALQLILSLVVPQESPDIPPYLGPDAPHRLGPDASDSQHQQCILEHYPRTNIVECTQVFFNHCEFFHDDKALRKWSMTMCALGQGHGFAQAQATGAAATGTGPSVAAGPATVPTPAESAGPSTTTTTPAEADILPTGEEEFSIDDDEGDWEGATQVFDTVSGTRSPVRNE
ncbi:hypothetical protein BGW39_004757 [Mortierella sp. 14UC]|nr:hypothetical protein BGW39_004757 [Mortierella sp. 14UC]